MKRKLLFWAIQTLVVLLALLVGVWLVDLGLRSTRPPISASHFGQSNRPALFDLTLYPYTGFHIQPNYHLQGKDVWTDFYKDFDIQSGEHGFFVDINLENPPAKKPNEYRIILVGGSGAQGMGGRTNNDMLYRQLEQQLNNALLPNGPEVKVINLAMAGGTTYTNFLALNKWGHRLDPDLILSFAGRNDLAETAQDDLPYRYQVLLGLSDATMQYRTSQHLAKWAEWFPGIINHSMLGQAMRLTDLQGYIDRAQIRYRESYGGAIPAAIPLYLDALRSIRRDFPGVPVFVASQPWNPGQAPYSELHDALIPTAKAKLAGYGDGEWAFFDLHAQWRTKGLYNKKSPQLLVDNQCHMSNEGHSLAAKMLAPELINIIRRHNRPVAVDRQPIANRFACSSLGKASKPFEVSLSADAAKRADRLWHESIVATTHDHCFHPDDFKDQRAAGITVRTINATVDGVVFTGDRAFSLAAPGPGWANRGVKAIDLVIASAHREGGQLIRTLSDIEAAKRNGHPGFVLAIEGARPLEQDLRNLQRLYDKGLRQLQLCWAVSNAICHDRRLILDEPPISIFGEQVIAEAEKLGIVLDLTHMTNKQFDHAVRLIKSPFIVSHSTAFGVLNEGTDRITDDRLKVIAKIGGVVGIHFAVEYNLSSTNLQPTITDVVDHIDYIRKKIGIDFIAVGTDWFQEPTFQFVGGGETMVQLPNLVREMVRRNYSDEDIRKVLGGNLLRVYRAVWRPRV